MIKNTLLISYLFVLIGLFSQGTLAADFCDTLFKLETRQKTDLVLDYDDDESYLELHRRRQAMGIMTSRFDPELDTRIYHGNTGLPNLNTGELPVVDPRARGLFVFLHGSGTMGATGKNFVALMNTMWEYGLAGLSFDLPYHADGPINEKFNSPHYFMSWIRKVIEKYRVPGMPVYLIGHSYGAELIPEFMMHFPAFVDGGLSISLVGFTPSLKYWYLTKTKNMNFDGVVTNSTGDKWADGVSEKFTWNKQIQC